MLVTGAFAAAKEMGFHVPEDVPVIGFDDVEQTTMFRPHVTTLVQPCREIGFRAMELLKGLLHGRVAPHRELPAHHLAQRESTQPCRQSILDFAACISGR